MWPMVIKVFVLAGGVSWAAETTRLPYDTAAQCNRALMRVDSQAIEDDFVRRYKHSTKRRRVARVQIVCEPPPEAYDPECQGSELWCHRFVNHS